MLKNRSWHQALFPVGMAATLLGCGDGETDQLIASQADALRAPDTIMLQGRQFLRKDRWNAAELKAVMAEGRPTRERGDLVTTAAQLRMHARYHGVHYVQQDLDLELAQRVLDSENPDNPQLPPPTLAQAPREARVVIGSDTRFESVSTGYPNSAVGFLETGASGNHDRQADPVYRGAHALRNRGEQPVDMSRRIARQLQRVAALAIWCAQLRRRYDWLPRGCDVPTVPNGWIEVPNVDGEDEAWFLTSGTTLPST